MKTPTTIKIHPSKYFLDPPINHAAKESIGELDELGRRLNKPDRSGGPVDPDRPGGPDDPNRPDWTDDTNGLGGPHDPNRSGEPDDPYREGRPDDPKEVNGSVSKFIMNSKYN
ncbi:hypothetical protein DEO72_LG3g1565 [Vigna unguiculata]|uniref:Uncharacterized protein n=1 Tax=Vigna unguiculata TaxID=3917 RepID=A0A4D6LFQ6_VIGUN|nr:hypothetical protein DEO72_LG3g1565 [Vigna unguiculata]